MRDDVPSDTSGTDWAAVHAALAATRHAMESNFIPTREMQQSILTARARLLAQEEICRDTGSDTLEAVVFTMAHEQYAIELAHIREVYPLRELTPLPSAPAYLIGVVTIRGQVIPLIDLKRLFGLPEKGLADMNRVIVLRNAGTEIGILADLIVGVRTFDQRQLQPEIPTLSGLRKVYLEGVSEDGTILLHAAAILADPELALGRP